MLWLELRRLRSSDELKRASAAHRLGSRKESQAVEALIAALADRSFFVRSAAAESLGRIGAEHAVEPLAVLLSDGSSSVRGSVAGALGSIADPRVVQPLIAALVDPDAGVRKIAAEALTRDWASKAKEALRDYRRAEKDATRAAKRAYAQRKAEESERRAEEARVQRQLEVERSLEALKSGDSSLEQRREAARRLTALDWKPADGMEQAIRGMVVEDWAEVLAAKSAAVEPLLAELERDHLRQRNYAWRAKIISALGAIGDVRAVGPLLHWHHHTGDPVQQALIEIGDAAVPALLQELEDPAVAPTALAVLWKASEEAILEALVGTSEDPGSGARQRRKKRVALSALEPGQRDLLIRRHVEPLGRILGDRRRFREHAFVIERLSVMRFRDALPAQLIVDWYAELPRHGAADLGYSGRSVHVGRGATLANQPVAAAADWPRDLVDEIPKAKAAAFRALLDQGAAAVGPLVTLLSASTDDDRAVEVIGLLARFEDRRSAEALVERLSSKAAKVRKAAVRGLEDLGWKPESLEQRVAHAVARGDFRTALGFGAAAVEPLVAILRDEDPNVRADVLAALGRLGESAGMPAAEQGKAGAPGKSEGEVLVEALISALRDESVNVRTMAAVYLARIGNAAPGHEIADPELARLIVDVLLARFHSPVSLRSGLESWETIMEAIIAMGPRAVEPLIAALDEGPARMQAIHALGEIGDPRAIGPLTHRAVYGNSSAGGWEYADRDKAAEALARFGSAAVPALLEAARHGNSTAADKLVEAGEARGIEPLLARARTDDANVSRNVDLIERLLQKSIGNVFTATLRELGHLPDLEAAVFDERGFRLLGRSERVDCSHVRQLARQELGRRGLHAWPVDER
jgi:HEAT repeat protein